MPGRPPTLGSERTRPHLAEFAELLASVRRQSGLTVRELADRIRYSHPHVARAATARRLPSWELTEAYLKACGVGGEDLLSWRRLWEATKTRERAFRRVGSAAPAKVGADDDWNRAVAAVREATPLLTFIEQVATLEGLRVALVRLGERHGFDTLRKIEATTGIPRATLHGWYSGKRQPSEARLDTLVVLLGATRAERHEFAACLTRIANEGSCDDTHPTTGHPCILSNAHKGDHQTAEGTHWLDGQNETPRPATLPANNGEPAHEERSKRIDRQSATQRGNIASAIGFLEDLLAARLRDYGPDHPDTLATRGELASWTGRSGDRSGAVRLFKELLADRLRVHGPDHPHTLTTRSNLAAWTGQSGDVAGAVRLFKELLADRLRVDGPDHRDTLATLSELAAWTGESGDVVGAIGLFTELLAAQLRVRSAGAGHPDTLATRSSLAFWTERSGDRAGAVRLYKELLAAQLRVHGKGHPNTLATRNNLAACTERMHGPDHPNTVATRSDLAFWTGRSGDATGAVRLYKELLAVQLRVHGPDHPDTLETHSNLAAWTGKNGDVTGAIALFTELLAAQLRVLGAGHRDTLATRNHLVHWTDINRRQS